jgi:hypothetical protein
MKTTRWCSDLGYFETDGDHWDTYQKSELDNSTVPFSIHQVNPQMSGSINNTGDFKAE